MGPFPFCQALGFPKYPSFFSIDTWHTPTRYHQNIYYYYHYYLFLFIYLSIIIIIIIIILFLFKITWFYVRVLSITYHNPPHLHLP
jgi:hypothetical protein